MRSELSTNASTQHTMEIASSRILNASHWLSANRNVTIGLAIGLPSLVLLLSTTPVTSGLAQTWRRVTGRTSSKIEATRPERGETRSYDKPPELPKKSYGQLSSEKRAIRPDHSEPRAKTNNYKNNSPQSPKKSYAAAAAATPASIEPVLPLTPDDASITSDASSEHSHKQKFRLGQNIKKRWQNRPFGHGSTEPSVSP